MTIRPAGEPLLRKLADYPDTVRARALAAREMLLGHAPECWELLYSRRVLSTAFSHTGALRDAFCHVALYTGHANLGFNRGAELADPEQRLLGSGSMIRHVHLDDELALNDEYLTHLITSAIDLSRRRLAERQGEPTRGTLLVK